MIRQCLALGLAAAIALSTLSFLAGGYSSSAATGEPLETALGSEGPLPRYATGYTWTMQRYNVTHSGTTKSPSPDTNTIFWTGNIGNWVVSSPAIAEGKVFVGAGNGGTTDAMYAFYQDNGTLAWRTQLDNGVNQNQGLTSSPAYDNGMLFYGGDKIYGVYANNGTVKWRVNTGNGNWGDGTPTVYQGKVYIGGSDWYLYKIDQFTGVVDWRFGPLNTQPVGNSNYGLYSAPAMVGNWLYLAACDGYVYKLDINQPGPTATYTYRSARYATMYGSPVIYNGTVFIGDGYTFTGAANRFRALSANDLSFIWAFNPGRSTSYFSSAAVAYDTIYTGDIAGYLYAIYPSNGTRKWEYRFFSQVWSSPAISDGKLFIGAKNGNLYSFNANQTGAPAPRWQFPTGGEVDSSPAISDGIVCVGSRAGTLSCLGLFAPPIDQSPVVSAFEPGGTPSQIHYVGQSIPVRWSATDDHPMPANNVNISYGSGSSWTDVIRNTANDGLFPWDTTGVTPGTYWINVSAYDSIGQSSYDSGNYSFQIALAPDIPPNVFAYEPGGTPGQMHVVGLAIQVRWLATDDNPPMPANNINISYGIGPTWTDVIRGAGNTGSYSWDTTGVPLGTYVINVSAYDSKGQSTFDLGNFTFEIVSANQPPTIVINQPAGGESWTGGSVHGIAWTANDPEDPPALLKVWMNYSITGGAPFNLQVPGVQGAPGDSGPYAWTVPLENSITVVLNATVVDSAGDADYYLSSQFEIDSTAPLIQSTNPPSGGVGVPTNANVLTTWSEPMNSVSAQIAFSLQDTATWTPVAGSFSWAGSTMTFNPTGALSPSIQYSANITTAARDDSDLGNNLATPYSWTFTTAATSDSTPPTVISVTALPDPQEVPLPVNVSALVQDNVAVAEVWLNVTDPIGGQSNVTMSFDGVSGRYFRQHICGELGPHSFEIWAADTSANWNPGSGQFACDDTTSPTIVDLRIIPNPAEVLSLANISAIITDNHLVAGAWLNITMPDLTSTNNSMTSGARYFWVGSPSQIGAHGFRVWAVDIAGNWATDEIQREVRDTVPPAISGITSIPDPVEFSEDTNITATVTDNYVLSEVYVNITYPDSTWSNQSMLGGTPHYSVAATGQLGTHNFVISAVDSSGNWARATDSFNVVDTTPPQIAHTPVASWLTGSNLNLSATIIDNHAVNTVTLNYTDVDGVARNMTATHGAQDAYYYIVPGQTHSGTLAYFFWTDDPSGNTARTQTHTASIAGSRPNPPTGLTVAPEGLGALMLNWFAPTNNEDGSPLTDLAGYNVYRMATSGGSRTLANTNGLVGVTQFLDTGLQPGTTYYYVVRAQNLSSVESVDSNQASGTTLNATPPGDVFPLILTIIIIVIAVIMIIILLILSKRKKKEEVMQNDAPGEFVPQGQEHEEKPPR